MTPVAVLRTLLAAGVGLFVVHVLIGASAPSNAAVVSELGLPSSAEVVATLTILVAWVVALIGLWMMRRWARIANATVMGAGLLLTLFTPSFVTTPAEEFIYGLELVMSGILLAVTYYSPVAKLFEAGEAAA